MKRSKDIFLELLESFFGRTPWDEEVMDEKLEKQEFDASRGNYKTNIEVFYNQQGFPVTVRRKTEYVPTKDEKLLNDKKTLEKQLGQAVEDEDYALAADIQAKLRALPERV